MKKYNIYMSMAALAIVGAMMSSCAEEIEVAQPANTDKTVMVKTTVSLDENGSTRALTEAGVKTFAVGEQIAVIYKNTSDETVKVESVELKTEDIDNTNAHNATFSVPLTNPKPGGDVRYIYPASRAATTVATDAAVDNDATINYAALANQDGTFASLASNLDIATFDGNLTESGTLPATASLANPLTIGKFTISSGDADVTGDMIGLNISDGTNTYSVTTTTALSTFYVAMQPVSSTQTVAVNATDGTYHYTRSVTGKTLAASKIYDIAVTINITPGANLSAVTADYIAQDGEELTGTLGSNVKISIADGATVTLNNVTINGVDNSSYNWAGITCEGDATIILANGSTNTVRGFLSSYPGIFVPVDNTLTIQGGSLGTGTLYASNNGGESAGIGAGYGNNCGNIEIQGGNITAMSSEGAGIGAGQMGKCGNITISGGTITATSTNGAGIGGGAGGTSDAGQCGNITISGGTITATSSNSGAGIGGGYEGPCGNITISGGTITATSSNSGAGIGGGDEGPCGVITITNGVTKVTATKGASAQQCIGKGETSDCGTVTFGTATVYTGSDWTPSPMVSGSYGGLNLAISTTTSADDTWTLSYNAHSVTNAVPGDLGKLIGADGKIYATMAQASAAGTTAVAMIAYVGSETGSATCNHGLAIALTDATTSYCAWAGAYESAGVSTSQTVTDHKAFLTGIADTETLVTKYGAGYAAYIAKNYGVAAPTGTSGWFLPSSGQWLKFFEAAGVDVANWTSWNWAPAPSEGTQADNWTKINNLLTAVGSSIEQYWYWSSSESNSGYAVGLYFNSSNGVKLSNVRKDNPNDYVRSFLAF
jgi:hypothetical protein